MADENPLKWRQYQPEIILFCVRSYLRYALSYHDLEELMVERGLGVDHTTIFHWVQRYAPELERRVKRHLKLTNDSWRVDETSVKVKGRWLYLYRVVNSDGTTLEFMLSEQRDARAAKRFFCKALKAPHTAVPRVINVDKHAAYPKAMRLLKQRHQVPKTCRLRQVTYLSNGIEQDHRAIKRVVKRGLSFGSFATADRTLAGYEAMPMLRKGQVHAAPRGDIRSQVRFIETAFGIAA